MKNILALWEQESFLNTSKTGLKTTFNMIHPGTNEFEHYMRCLKRILSLKMCSQPWPRTACITFHTV